MLLDAELFQVHLLSIFAMGRDQATEAYSKCGQSKVLYANSLVIFEATCTFLLYHG